MGSGVAILAARGNHDAPTLPPNDRLELVPDYQVRSVGGLRVLFLGCLSVRGDVGPPPADLPGAELLISHEAPFNPQMGWAGHPTVRAVLLSTTPSWCFSGHWHHAARGQIGPTACHALGADPAGWVVADIEAGRLRLIASA